MSLLTELVDTSRRRLQETTGSRVFHLPEDVRHRVGTLGEARAEMHSFAWSLPGVSWFRLAALDAGERASVFSALAFPDPSYDLDMFGAEVVQIRGRVTVIAIDWMPVVSKGRFDDLLAPIQAQFGDMCRSDGLPEWAARSFSAHALFSRPAQPIAPDRIVSALAAYLSGFLETVAHARRRENPEAAREAIASYARSHFDHDPGGRMLEGIFGPEWVERYSREFLFRVPKAAES